VDTVASRTCYRKLRKVEYFMLLFIFGKLGILGSNHYVVGENLMGLRGDTARKETHCCSCSVIDSYHPTGTPGIQISVYFATYSLELVKLKKSQIIWQDLVQFIFLCFLLNFCGTVG